MGINKSAPEMSLLDTNAECYVCQVVQKGIVTIDYGDVFRICKKCLGIANNIALGNILYKVSQMRDGAIKLIANALTFREAKSLYENLGGGKNPLVFMSVDTGGG